MDYLHLKIPDPGRFDVVRPRIFVFSSVAVVLREEPVRVPRRVLGATVSVLGEVHDVEKVPWHCRIAAAYFPAYPNLAPLDVDIGVGRHTSLVVEMSRLSLLQQAPA